MTSNWRRTGRKRNFAAGFTLIEVMVAVVLLGLTFGSVFQVIALSFRSMERRDMSHQAMQYAQNKMNELLASEEVYQAGHLSGAWNEQFHWRAELVLREVDDLKVDRTRLTTRLLDIRMTVFYKYRGTEKDVRLFCTKVVPKPKIGQRGYLGG